MPRRRLTINFEETAYWLDQAIPATLEFRSVEGWRVALSDLGRGESLAVTAEFGEVDTGLTATEEGVDVRCELLAVARTGTAEVAAAVVAAAEKLRSLGGIIPAQPGVLLPKLTDGTALDQKPYTVRHGMLIVPYLWGGQTPRLPEEDRLTVVCQLVLLTEAEYAYAVEEGVAALQEEVGHEEIDLLDWSRGDD